MERHHPRARYVPSRHNKAKVIATLATGYGNENKGTFDYGRSGEDLLSALVINWAHCTESTTPVTPASLSVSRSEQCERSHDTYDHVVTGRRRPMHKNFDAGNINNLLVLLYSAISRWRRAEETLTECDSACALC